MERRLQFYTPLGLIIGEGGAFWLEEELWPMLCCQSELEEPLIVGLMGVGLLLGCDA